MSESPGSLAKLSRTAHIAKSAWLALVPLLFTAYLAGLFEPLRPASAHHEMGQADIYVADRRDFRMYWEGGERLRHNEDTLYPRLEAAAENRSWYIYPPLLACIVAAFNDLPFQLVQRGYGLLQILAVLALPWLLYRLVARPGTKAADFMAPVMTLTLLPAFYDLQAGNVNLLSSVVVVAALLWVERGKHAAGGALMGAAAHLKVLPVVFLVVFILQGRFKAAGAMAVAMALLWFAPLVWTIPAHGLGEGITRGHGVNVAYFERIVAPRLASQSASNLGDAYVPNCSLNAAMRRLFEPELEFYVKYWSAEEPVSGPLLFALPARAVRAMGLCVAMLMALAGCAACLRLKSDSTARLAGGVLVFLPAMLGNLLFWNYHFVVLSLALAPLAAQALFEQRGRGVYRAFWVIGFTLGGLVFIHSRALSWAVALGVPTFAAVACWALLLRAMLRRERGDSESQVPAAPYNGRAAA